MITKRKPARILNVFAFSLLLYLVVLLYAKSRALVPAGQQRAVSELSLSVLSAFETHLKLVQQTAVVTRPRTVSPRVTAVREAIAHAFDGYAKHAWGFDELMPLAQSGKNSFCQSGATIIDSLSTLWLAQLTEQFDKAADWALSNDFSRLTNCNLFETTIRVVGGLLSAGALASDERFYRQAQVIADLMLPSFETAGGVPCNTFPLAKAECFTANLAEAGTLVVEFTYLSQVTREPKYQRAAERAMRTIALGRNVSTCLPGLYHSNIETRGGRGVGSCWASMGGGFDSFFEYMLKLFVLVNEHESFAPYKRMWDLAMNSTYHNLLRCSNQHHMYIGAGDGTSFSSGLEHLACFLGGNLVLGNPAEYARVAAAVTESCVAMYTATASGLGADGVEWVGSLPLETCLRDPAGHASADLRVSSAHNLQRPETVESLYYLWKHTHNNRYRELGWEIFSKLNQTRITSGGYASVMDVNAEELRFDDLQQSFFIAEELKYLLLLFADAADIPVDLESWVFNTEAHPLPKFDPLFESSLGDVCASASYVCA